MAKDLTLQDFRDMVSPDNQEDVVVTTATTYTREELIKQVGKSDKTIRNWIKAIKKAYHWEPPATFHSKTATGKFLYTSFTFEQLQGIKEHLANGGNLDTWKESVEEPYSENGEIKDIADNETSEPQIEANDIPTSALATYQPQQLPVTDSLVEKYLEEFSSEAYQSEIEAEFVNLDAEDALTLTNSREFEEAMIAQREARRKAEAEAEEIRRRKIAQNAIAKAEADFALEQQVYTARRQQLNQSLGK